MHGSQVQKPWTEGGTALNGLRAQLWGAHSAQALSSATAAACGGPLCLPAVASSCST